MKKNLAAGIILMLMFLAIRVSAAEILSLNLGVSDIQEVAFGGNDVWLKLAPSASSQLEHLTSSNQGKLLEITVDGMPAMKIHIRAAVYSGIVEISDASPELLERLQEVDKRIRATHEPVSTTH
ncbi:MAG TPA: hypothetical protein ENO16_04675 [Chromatiales bacterium]|nr:hypothetical protein [Chromatiales bacterium]